MPAGLPPTPWIQGYEHPALFLQGYGQGAAQAQARARLQQAAQEQALQMQLAQQKLAQDAQQTQAELQIKQQLAQQNYLQEQQKIAIADQYRQQQIALGKQRLDEVHAMNQEKNLQVARKLQAQGRMESYRDELVAGGIPFDQAATRAAVMFGPELGYSGTAMASATRAMQQATAPSPQVTWVPPNEQTQAPGYLLDAKGAPHFPPREAQARIPHWVDIMDRAIEATEKELDAPMKKEVSDPIKEKNEARKRRVNAYYASIGEAVPYPDAKPKVMEMPGSKSELVKGNVYKTKHGPASWDGERFTLIEEE